MITTERSTPLAASVDREAGWQAVLVGKGGAGKTILAALLALCATREGERVLAVDADSEADLAYRLGVPIERAHSFVPLARNIPYIDEKIPASTDPARRPAHPLNPDVDDVFERFAIPVRDRLHLLVMGSLETPVSGCRCPEHALITAILRYLAHRNRDAVIIDAGGIHPPEELFGVLFPHALIITEPTFNSLRIAEQVTRQALDREVPHLHLVVNKIRTERDVEKVKEFATGLTCYEHVFSLPYEEGVQYADPDVSGLLGRKTELMEEVWKLYRVLQATPMNQEQAEVSD